tara:strand:- start:229 stop:513 length:285 start_codon:yes stop_codon:yes gene_type:complete
MLTELTIGIATIIEIFVILWGLAQLNKELRHSVEDLEESMDSKLALVLQNGLIGDPINPIQAAIANMMQSAAERSQGNIKEIVRDDNGLFSKKD